MKIIGLDNREYTWNLAGKVPLENETRPRSELHTRARGLLRSIYSGYRILEEVYLPGSGGLYIDFFLPQLMAAIEVQGEEHYKYVSHFHKSLKGFLDSKKRDAAKLEWCRLNNITLVQLPFSENENVWRIRIYEAIG